jgi:ADP-heptose:LPS heptosyltransferase
LLQEILELSFGRTLNVLLIRAGALGDIVLMRTTVAALRVSGHSVSLLAPSAAGSALLGLGPCEVDAVLPWEAAMFAGLLAAGTDVAPALREALAPFQAVIAYSASVDLRRGLAEAAPAARIVTHPPLPPAGGPHAAAWLAAAVAELGADPVVGPPTCAASGAETRQAQPWLDRLGPGFLAFHPGSGAPRKNWAAERVASLAARLSAGRPFLLVEGAADAEAAAPALGLPCAVRARDLPPRVLGAVLARAGLYVGNDSGVSHLAAAWGAPVLALFGPTDPAQWSPVGPHVTVLRAQDGKMASLEVEAVVQTGRQMLGSEPATETIRHD